ncbi:hypothetical protein EKO23_16900 [Nocardioides guangzhouensis]|uniref:DUF1269 domain-containing protein n=1 Tax=Nocardioides guangzhouensis TaxID=2497878 RepID=A0A4Q4Z9B0_9ACTN|nr:hypothetical protein [Nocardioides guangzhouensis]RYP84148.1 hypothetical protein EKO23_16900 [Nocardioides guangzhouensis]
MTGSTFGPVQVLVFGFDEPSFSGEVLAELGRLRDAGIVRLVDVLLVTRRADGALDTVPPPPGADPDLGRVAAALFDRRAGEPEGEEGDAWSLDDAVPTGGTAAVALIEHTWAVPLIAAIGRAGGRPLDETWLAADDLALLESLAGR